MRYPPLYVGLQKGRELSPKSFMIWFAKSIYQGFAIMMMGILFTSMPAITMVTTTFTALIIIEILNVVTEVSRLNRIVFASCAGSVLLYFSCIIFLPEYFDTSVLDETFFYFVVLTVVVAWLPVYLINFFVSTYYPTKDQKLMRQVTSSGHNGIRVFCNRLVGKLIFWRKPDIHDMRRELIEME